MQWPSCLMYGRAEAVILPMRRTSTRTDVPGTIGRKGDGRRKDRAVCWWVRLGLRVQSMLLLHARQLGVDQAEHFVQRGGERGGVCGRRRQLLNELVQEDSCLPIAVLACFCGRRCKVVGVSWLVKAGRVDERVDRAGPQGGPQASGRTPGGRQCSIAIIMPWPSILLHD